MVKIDSAPLMRMLELQQLEPHQLEAGGILLGRRILNSPDVVIDEVTCPLPGDRRRPLSFYRGRARHQQVIDERWKNSGGTCLYLGEWHTHPEPIPSPSLVDLGDWNRRLREDRFEGSSLFFIIVGTHGICVWEGRRDSREIIILCQR
ncbi:Mov34/MPN/PAD-1 family protein [Corallococcus terminator]|uniref:Mov34/MPN/PAD-1 family protein n=1 Tax=Corallococcus terminator TaxID=2316733 RepID=UPI00131594DE|nr:Mov34/MPN/PAD-1 family protein [Corallococcus terminator]